MDFQLINVELTEARLFQRSKQFGLYDGKAVSNLLYLQTLSLYMMYLTPELNQTAKTYAEQTGRYGTYSLFRTHATDLYMLCYQVSHPNNDHANIADPVASKKFLKSLGFDSKQHIRLMRAMASNDVPEAFINAYFYRLETQLKISDGRYKSWRRQILNWANTSDSTKSSITKNLKDELKRISRNSIVGSEIFTNLQSMQSQSSRRVSTSKQDKPSTLKRVAGTAAGAVAGGYAGKKIAQKFNKDTDKYKKVGAGIGAIAGYWASGKRGSV